MPFLFMLSVAIQILCAIHVVRSGNDRYWVFIILLFPAVGCLLYFIIAIIPEMLHSRTTVKALHSVKRKINPKGTLKLLQDELLISETSQNYLAVADEYHRLGQYKQAVEHYQKALSGIFSSDQEIMYRLALAQYATGDAQGCVKTIDKINHDYPRFKSQDLHLLCARALAEYGDVVRADHEFSQLIEYYSGPQARYYYAKMLRTHNRTDEAIVQLETAFLLAKRSKPHYRKFHKKYLQLAKSDLKLMKKG